MIWPDDDHITAAAPTSLKVNWFAGKDKRDLNVVLFNITWSQQSKDLISFILCFKKDELKGIIRRKEKKH